MRVSVRRVTGVILVLGCSAGARHAAAADPEVTAALLPMREAMVDGDRDTFRAQRWMTDGYAGGLKDLSVKHAFADGTTLETESHAIAGEDDFGSELSLKKPTLGFFNFDYSEFRKYYDKTGGVYQQFGTLSGVDSFKDLSLNIGKVGFETGLTLEGLPQVSLSYEREFKDGTKSRLSWAAATEGTTVRKILPSWQDIKETVDGFGLKTSYDLAGCALKGEQRWEFVRSETNREERQFSTTSTASDKKVREQAQAPHTDLMTTTLSGERGFFGEKLFLSSAYHYAHLENREVERLQEFNAAGVLTNFSNPEQKFDSRADTNYHTHAWVENLIFSPWRWLTFGAKLKTEVLKRNSNSSYPADGVPNSTGGSAPNGVLDRTDNSLTDSKAVKWGEGFSVRTTIIPRTALYTELDLEQVRLLLREDRQSLDGPDTGNGSSSGEIFNRETVTKLFRGIWTLGGQFSPWSFLNFTTQVRHRQNNTDYDDQRETANPLDTTARSAFIDGQNVATNEFTTRATLRPRRWLRTSFRYQFRADTYATRAEAEQIVKTGMRTHTYTYDVTLQPIRTVTTTASFSRQTSAIWSPARFAGSGYTPTFNANVDTWMLGTVYAPTPSLTLTNNLLYSSASNFNDDVIRLGLPLGADFQRVDVTTGVTWSVTPDTSVGTQYAMYHYLPNEAVQYGDYTAHVLWLDVTKKF